MDMESQKRKILHYIGLLDQKRYSNTCPLEEISFCPAPYKESAAPPSLSSFVPYRMGDDWASGKDSHAWFHFVLNVPEAMRQKPVELVVKTNYEGWDATNPQMMLYIDGAMRQGFDTNHTQFRLDDYETHDVYIYAYSGPRVEHSALFVSLRNLDEAVEGLYYDISVPAGMLSYLPTYSGEYALLLHHLDHALSLLDLCDMQSEAFYASVEVARAYMRDEFYGKYCKEQPMTTVCIGHTHIDCAWRWTLAQTREKVQRSFGTVLQLMREYPEYRFMSSQALLYKYLKEEDPALYAQVAERIREGRWECEGAMWVEADCNLSSGESLVRQLLYGKRFFKKEFGVDNKILWLPDVFGYSAALPQILRKCGVEWFITSKISWNDTNQMPNDTFLWKGIDGTDIYTYFLTPQDKTPDGPVNRTTYNAKPNVEQLAGTWDRYHNKTLNNEVLLTFGFGDGGGGPTKQMLETIRRETNGLPGAPNAKIDTVTAFLSRLGDKVRNASQVPVWRGELYLEFHRGTYTTLSKNKRNNRKSEFLYQNAEFYATLAKTLLDQPFPKAKLAKGWEDILTNQFHDIIPGSSIREVYEDSDASYAELMAAGETVARDAMQAIASRIAAQEGTVVFNPNTVTKSGYVRIGGKCAYVENIPQKGYACVHDLKLHNRVKIEGKQVETPRLSVRFNDAWQLVSVFDKKNERELLSAGACGNEFRLYEDYPHRYDAWEWQDYSRQKYRVWDDVSDVSEAEDGARRGIRVTRRYKNSAITQTVWFYDEAARIDFETVADWHEKHHMLKTAFGVDINADKATYDIQFGSVERPAHFNTSWDAAKFEVCAHKYADYSDGGFGVSLLNDCKYGYDIHEGVMQLSLLRCPSDPYEEADEGEMRCTYSLLLHEGGVGTETVAAAYELNTPLTALAACGERTTLPISYSFLSVSDANVICETVKEAEDGCDTILRLYESANKKGKVTLTFAEPVRACFLCDMMENVLSECPVQNGTTVTLPIGGFEILTLKIVF